MTDAFFESDCCGAPLRESIDGNQMCADCNAVAGNGENRTEER